MFNLVVTITTHILIISYCTLCFCHKKNSKETQIKDNAQIFPLPHCLCHNQDFTAFDFRKFFSESVFFFSEKKKLKSSSAKSYSILYLVKILFRSIFIGLASNHLRKLSHLDLFAFAQLAASTEFP